MGATSAQLAHSVRAPYLGLAAFAFVLALITAAVKLPKLLESGIPSGFAKPQESAWQFRNLRLAAVTILGHGPVAVWAIVLCGLCNSIMWPCIFHLGLKGLGPLTSQGSGILVMMVVGGAIVPEIQGYLADTFGYQLSFVAVLFCYAYLIYFALSGYKARQSRFPSVPDFTAPVETV